MIVYGPVPSRRLGQSIGINNIPPKTCTYSCIYCQLGRTNKMSVKRCEFYKPEDIFNEAKIKWEQLVKENRHVDYFTFVPDGEPTLDINLGKEIELIRHFNTKIAVITNASLLWMDSVKEDLMKADWVSVSIDAADEDTWHKIDRPHGLLNLSEILNGITEFSKEFRGTLVTETMLVDKINDSDESIKKIAEELSLIHPNEIHLLVPTRPPAENYVKRTSKERLLNAARIIRDATGLDVECITGDEKEDGFFFTEAIVDDLLSITSVHPVREDIIEELLRKRKAEKTIVTTLVEQGRLQGFIYEGKKFYRKSFQKR